MPIPGGGRFRMVPLKGGGFERLHFDRHGMVNEAKNLKTGATHTPAEFKADKKRHGRTLLSR